MSIDLKLIRPGEVDGTPHGWGVKIGDTTIFQEEDGQAELLHLAIEELIESRALEMDGLVSWVGLMHEILDKHNVPPARVGAGILSGPLERIKPLIEATGDAPQDIKELCDALDVVARWDTDPWAKELVSKTRKKWDIK